MRILWCSFQVCAVINYNNDEKYQIHSYIGKIFKFLYSMKINADDDDVLWWYIILYYYTVNRECLGMSYII